MTTVESRTELFRMPALGADMTEGRVVEWLIQEGETADRGDLVAIIETDKSDIEVEVFEPCTFDEFVVELGELVQVGDPIARITLAQDARSIATPSSQVDEDPREAVATERAIAASTGGPRPTRRVSPRARRLAAERGIDLDQLDTQGTVTGDMVERLAADGDHERSARPRTASTTGMRRAIASVMERSWSEIPHYHVMSTLDLTEAQQRLERDNVTRDIADRVVLAAVVNVAIARAAKNIPAVNGWWRSNAFTPSPTVDLGMILSLRTGGIVVPTIPDADGLDPLQMMQAMRRVVEGARRGRLRESDLRPASISVTSMGDLGTDSVFGVIYPPQVTLIGVGTPRLRPAVVDGEVVPRLLANLTVTGDHRAHDGLIAARLARYVSSLIEELP